MEKAVAYIRVSSQRQVDEGSSLDSQTKQVEHYANNANLELVRVFREEGESAKTDQRPRLQEMLKFCLDRRNGISVVIVPKIDRLARNVNDYTNLKLQLSRMGVRLESLGEKIDDTPVGRFTETILASVAQFDNEIRAERSKGGMVEAVSTGRWVWKAPVGYRSVRHLGKGTIEPDPTTAPLIQMAFKQLARGQQSTRAVREFLASAGISRSESSFYRMLENEVYLGRIHAFGRVFKAEPPFVPLVDEITFRKAGEALLERNVPKRYQKETSDFPLRGTMRCGCDRLFSASWSKGKLGTKYPYYRCHHCAGKSITRQNVHSFFLNFLSNWEGNPFGWDLIRNTLTSYSADRKGQMQKRNVESQARLDKLMELRDAVAMKNVAGVLSDDLAKRQIDRLTKEISECASAISPEVDAIDTKELVDFAESFFTNLKSRWESMSLKMKKDLLRFMFPNGVLFHPERGFRTPENSLLEQLSRVVSGSDLQLVDPTLEFSKLLHEWLELLRILSDKESPSPSQSTSTS